MAVVETESYDSWKWFLMLVNDDLQLGSGFGYTFISDQQKGLLKAVRELLPHAEHRNCTRHIYANLQGNSGSEAVRNAFYQASCATHPTALKEAMKFLEKASTKMNQFDPKVWSNTYFQTHSKTDSTENNISKSFNSWILRTRYMPLIDMFTEIHDMIMERLHEKRDAMGGVDCIVLPRIKRELDHVVKESVECSVIWDRRQDFQVKWRGIGEAELMEEALMNEMEPPQPSTPRRSQRISKGAQNTQDEETATPAIFMPTPVVRVQAGTGGTPLADKPGTSKKNKAKGPVKGSGFGYTFISDQQKGLLKAVRELLPHAEHRNCTRHIYANLQGNSGSEAVRNAFYQASCATHPTAFKEAMKCLEKASTKMNQFDPKVWSNAYFQTHSKTDSTENNLSKSFNSWILRTRCLDPIKPAPHKPNKRGRKRNPTEEKQEIASEMERAEMEVETGEAELMEEALMNEMEPP
ncbi:hypothetical protein POM88_000792 [Heracleum sosnowskyi]|uniref:MULE transposase domain-containing protein n=1 Tax=Heracleum sosnowskyi TaxID=360622 RepID=A0AAD8JEX8_9APIA|nr:hypothetical protein POM88_000792 [Heracleum sosnowskyi]